MRIGSNGWNPSIASLSHDSGVRIGTSLEPGTPNGFRYFTATGMWLEDQVVPDFQPGKLPADGPVHELLLPRERRPDFELRIGRVRMQPLLRILAVVSAAVFAALVLAGIIVWWLARMTGSLALVNDLVGSAVGQDGFELSGTAVLSVWTVLAALLASVGAVVVALMGAIYNRAAELVGGLVFDGSVEDTQAGRAGRPAPAA